MSHVPCLWHIESGIRLLEFKLKSLLIFQGIEAHPLQDDSIFEWTAKIQGLKRTLWEGMRPLFSLYHYVILVQYS
jgi:ubiquitin-protein ligase